MANKRENKRPARTRTARPGKTGGGGRKAVAAGLGLLGVAAAAVGAAVKLGWLDQLLAKRDGHAAPDLSPDAPPVGEDRAPAFFRPDPDGPVDPADRESLRPPPGIPVTPER